MLIVGLWWGKESIFHNSSFILCLRHWKTTLKSFLAEERMSKEDKRLENGTEPNLFFSLKASSLSLISNHSILDIPRKSKGNIREMGKCNETPKTGESRTESTEEERKQQAAHADCHRDSLKTHAWWFPNANSWTDLL